MLVAGAGMVARQIIDWSAVVGRHVVPLVEGAGDVYLLLWTRARLPARALEPADVRAQLHVGGIAEDSRRRFDIAAVTSGGRVVEREPPLPLNILPVARRPLVPPLDEHDFGVDGDRTVPLLLEILTTENRGGGAVLMAVVVPPAAPPGGPVVVDPTEHRRIGRVNGHRHRHLLGSPVVGPIDPHRGVETRPVPTPRALGLVRPLRITEGEEVPHRRGRILTEYQRFPFEAEPCRRIPVRGVRGVERPVQIVHVLRRVVVRHERDPGGLQPLALQLGDRLHQEQGLRFETTVVRDIDLDEIDPRVGEHQQMASHHPHVLAPVVTEQGFVPIREMSGVGEQRTIGVRNRAGILGDRLLQVHNIVVVAGVVLPVPGGVLDPNETVGAVRPRLLGSGNHTAEGIDACRGQPHFASGLSCRSCVLRLRRRSDRRWSDHERSGQQRHRARAHGPQT